MFYADNFCKCQENYNPHTYTFTGLCKKTGKTYSVTVPAEALYKYNAGELIQDALSMLSSPDREFLMTGYSPEGWKQVFRKGAK